MGGLSRWEVEQAQSGLDLHPPGDGCGLRERGPEKKFCFKKIVRGQLMLHPLATTATGHWIAEHHMGKPPSTTPPRTNPSTTRGCKKLAARHLAPFFFN